MGAETARHDDLLTAVEAAAAVGVLPATIRQWVTRGYLRRSATRGRAALFDRVDVVRAAELTSDRRNSRPISPVAYVPHRYYNRRLTTDEVAKLFDVTPSTVRSWVRRGQVVPAGSSGRTHLFRLGNVVVALKARHR